MSFWTKELTFKNANINSGFLGMLPICKWNEQELLNSVLWFKVLHISTIAWTPFLPVNGTVTYSKPLMLPSLSGINPNFFVILSGINPAIVSNSNPKDNPLIISSTLSQFLFTFES